MNTEPKITRRGLLGAAAVAGITVVSGAADQPAAAQKKAGKDTLPAKPEDLGINARSLQVAYDLLEKWTTGADAPVPGGAIVVGRGGRHVPARFFGRQGPEPDAAPIRHDSLFLLASITKPITYLGALLLVERGQL